VTGGAGFIGCHLANRLAARGDQVVVADDFSSATWRNLVNFPSDVATVDVAGDTHALDKLFPFDAILHQASITDTTVMDQKKMMHNNVEGFRAILDLAVKHGSRVIWASSASIYGNGPAPMVETQPSDPKNVYAFSKLAMERLAVHYAPKMSRPSIALRYFNVYGPNEDHKGRFASMIHQLAKQMRAGKRPHIFTSGQQKRDFVHIDDIVQINFKALDYDGGGVFNAGSGFGESFNRVVAELNRVLKTNLEPEYFANPYGFTQDWTQADLTHSRKALGYAPKYDLAKGIDAYFASGQLGISAA
jgi:ADP-L-glycero-D-manno-heptose 6-epimerase